MSELELLLRLALSHNTCQTEKARIEDGAVIIPFDVLKGDRDPVWTIDYERVRTRGELLEALGHG